MSRGPRRYGSLGERRPAKHCEAPRWIEAHKQYLSDDCLFWPFYRNAHGYGTITIHKLTYRVHRVMCEHQNGPPPIDRPEAAHSCGNGHMGCVNPRHLRWASRKENVADTYIHGTVPRGERSGAAKLSEADVIAIRAVRNPNKSRLAKQFNVDRCTLRCVISRRTWAWL